jgi:HD-GYP domain-containing protein (c-di-GMP phosphodiesterase class II)
MKPAKAKGSAHSNRAVHRMLAWRVGSAALAIALAAGLTVYASERRSIADKAADRARTGMGVIEALAGDTGAASPEVQAVRFREALEHVWATARTPAGGRFVWVRIQDLQGTVLMQARNPQAGPETAELSSIESMQAASAAAHDKLVRIAGTPHVLVSMPWRGGGQAVQGTLTGLFAPSEQTLAEAKSRILRNALLATAIVLATALLLYPIIARLLLRVTQISRDLLDANLETMSVLGGAIAKRDSDTDAHNFRVTLYSTRLAEAAGLDHGAIRSLMKGAFLHDVGKIGIRDNILLKPGRLDGEEFTEMKRHVGHGLDIVERAAWLEDAADVVGCHHEKFDGSGYPRGLAGEDIPIGARIFAIADVFDALTSRRPYKDPLSLEAATELMEQGRGSHFDPRLLDLFAGIAPSLYKECANQDADRPRQEVSALAHRYFKEEKHGMFG